MFTGIVRTVGRIDERIEHAAGDVSFAVATAAIDPAGIAVGDSICVSGACLTAVEVTPVGFRTDVSAESLARTMLHGFAAGRRVNLETALKPDTSLGGHLVSGHVDGVAEVLARRGDARSVRFEIRAPEVLARYIAEKGSVCIDGVSLVSGCVKARVFGEQGCLLLAVADADGAQNGGSVSGQRSACCASVVMESRWGWLA